MQDEEMTTNMPPQEEGAEPSPEFVAEEAFLDARGAEIETLQAQIAELKNAVLRERADSDNLRKRFEREKESALKFGSEKLIKELLPVIDSLTLGLEAAKAHEAEGRQALDHFIEGSSMTLKLLLDVLQKNGVICWIRSARSLTPNCIRRCRSFPAPMRNQTPSCTSRRRVICLTVALSAPRR